VAVGRSHHPAALGDEVRVGALAHDRNATLGHDDDAKGVGKRPVEAGTLDEALDIAAGIPLAELGTIEVRAIYDIPGS
jgi:hypothetical protein